MKCGLLLVLGFLVFSIPSWAFVVAGEYEGYDLKGDVCRIKIDQVVHSGFVRSDWGSLPERSDSETRFMLHFSQEDDLAVEMSSVFIPDRGFLTHAWEHVSIHRAAGKKATRMRSLHLQVDRESGIPIHFYYQIISKDTQDSGECLRFTKVLEPLVDEIKTSVTQVSSFASETSLVILYPDAPFQR